MTTQEYDTDPSTPGAKRLSDPRPGAVEVTEDPPGSIPVDMGPVSPRARPTTDPGIAPPAEPLPVPGEPMGIVVPSVVRSSNDSVDVLLEGIRREQSERRGVPQTDGETAASYHVEHRVQAAHAARVEPSVLVDRPLLEQTVRIRMSGSSGSRGVLPGDEARDATQPTAVGARSMLWRMAVAVLAGVVVVVVIFAALRRISEQAAQEAPAPPTSQSSTAQSPNPANTSSTPKRDPEGAGAGESPPAVAALSSTARKPAPSAKPSKPKTKQPASAAKPTLTSEDLGEFKPAY